jgi:hypothetical protein
MLHNFIIYSVHKILFGDKIKDSEVGGSYACAREKRNTKFRPENVKKRHHIRYLVVVGE